MIKGLRRSLKGERVASSSTTSSRQSLSSSKPLVIAPPKKVIRALYDYQAVAPGELSFYKGDFFHVISDVDNDWYEASNPAADVQGIVPSSYFEVLGRNGRESVDGSSGGTRSGKTTSGVSEVSLPVMSSGERRSSDLVSSSSSTSSGRRPYQPLYGVVLYKFDAERPDELQAAEGDAVIVVAQSNHEWFVAKPIGRLGGPGLIPISFVELRDMATNRRIENVQEAISRAGVPKVEEWKKRMAEYKASTIPLGKFEDDLTVPYSQFQQMNIGGPSSSSTYTGEISSTHQRQPSQTYQPSTYNQIYSDSSVNEIGGYGESRTPAVIEQQQSQQQQQMQQPQQQIQQQSILNSQQQQQLQQPLLQQQQQQQQQSQLSLQSQQLLQTTSSSAYESNVVAARVDRFNFDSGRYWYLLIAAMEDGTVRSLCRYYQDFYDFQIKLLDQFQDEAGRTGRPRILPFIPGPVTYVNDSISSQRRVNLDEYVRKLIALPAYISQSALVKGLFALREGDVESTQPETRLPWQDQQTDGGENVSGDGSTVEGNTSGVSISALRPGSAERSPGLVTGVVATADYRSRGASLSSASSSSGARTQEGHSASSSRDGAEVDWRPEPGAPVEGGGAMTTPTMSTTKQMSKSWAGFLKIKVFYQEDLIAMRVPSDITYDQLENKLQERLGSSNLLFYYQDENSGRHCELTNDEEFANAVGNGTKLVLYAQ
ncbi:uncharacterized protein V1516DRAFT_674600 [Lipomyces oligophaga]|uniref:uncharacterized protein n=1 Tax=Lipomyces oligophaga TaxID=45792 RepID=UPI0034CEF815